MHPPQNARSVPRRPQSSIAFSHACKLPRFIPLPPRALLGDLSPAALAALTALLSRAPYALDRLVAGSRLVVRITVDELAGSIRISPNTLRLALGELADRGLVRNRGRRAGGSLLEIMPSAFGLPDDDLERRRCSVRRSYVPVPVWLAGRLCPRDLAVAIAAIEAAGVGVLTRAVADESIWVAIAEDDVATSTGLSNRTVRRSLEALREAGLIAGSKSWGGGWTVELLPEMFGLEHRTELTTQASESDKSAFSEPAHLLTEHEEGTERRGVRSRAAAIAIALQSLWVEAGSRVSSGRWRVRVRQVALQLAVAGASVKDAERLAVAISKERGRTAPPEAILDRWLEHRGRRAMTIVTESQFVGMLNEPSAPQAPPPVLAAQLDELEVRVWRWRLEIEAGDPAGEAFREILGGGLPWEADYVARRNRTPD